MGVGKSDCSRPVSVLSHMSLFPRDGVWCGVEYLAMGSSMVKLSLAWLQTA